MVFLFEKLQKATKLVVIFTNLYNKINGKYDFKKGVPIYKLLCNFILTQITIERSVIA